LSARYLKAQAENLLRQFAFLDREFIGIHFLIFLNAACH
jgi:hypothetical protein